MRISSCSGPAQPLGDLRHGRIETQTGLHAHRQQVEEVGQSPGDLVLPLVGRTADDEVGKVVREHDDEERQHDEPEHGQPAARPRGRTRMTRPTASEMSLSTSSPLTSRFHGRPAVSILRSSFLTRPPGVMPRATPVSRRTAGASKRSDGRLGKFRLSVGVGIVRRRACRETSSSALCRRFCACPRPPAPRRREEDEDRCVDDVLHQSVLLTCPPARSRASR